MIRAYTIFDDFDDKAASVIRGAGIELTVHTKGLPRPDAVRMKAIFEEYDCVIIGTSQKMYEDMFENICTPRIIATASVGLDHIRIPEEKKELITVLNTPKANMQSVAEYTIGCALTCCKRLGEGKKLYLAGKNNKALSQKPEDLYGKVLGVVGAGNISRKIMEIGMLLGMKVICWTAHPERHTDVTVLGVDFTDLSGLCRTADVISVNLPNNEGTKSLISEEYINEMKETATFISVSRKETIDIEALIRRAKKNPFFYVCLDIDVDEKIVELIPDQANISITPHIAGGTVETRKRMFYELAQQITALCTE